MVLKRVMPCLLFNGRGLVKTVKFKNPTYIGDPINAIKIYNEKEVDELILLDINASKEKRKPYFEKIKEFASECFMPFTYGGGVTTINDFKTLFSIGVEKVAVNTLLFTKPNIVKEAVNKFGAQAIVGVVDLKSNLFSKKQIHNQVGYSTKMNLKEYLYYLENEIGVGEILFQNVDMEGTWSGYNHNLIKEVINNVKVPVIVLGGANNASDIKKVLYETGASAAAIGSMAVYQKKDMGVLIRFPKREAIIAE
ncbi:MAG: imidazole glycerol phosphate synthase subunit HisF [Bacteroidia bacterium]|nr:imidazole glycerol phosphate synthase subunit HisF [Bacteroidia bacterium]